MAALLPTVDGNNEGVVLCDCGANVDCKPQNLLHFAIMADAYYKITTGKNDARVALLSNGTEDKKGSELNHEAFLLLKESKLNFVGNMEARDIISGNYDVIVADGFNGNIHFQNAERQYKRGRTPRENRRAFAETRTQKTETYDGCQRKRRRGIFGRKQSRGENPRKFESTLGYGRTFAGGKPCSARYYGRDKGRSF